MTVPVEDPIVATDGVLLLQVPPASASLNVVVAVPHTVNVPVIADTAVFTVTMALAAHPAPGTV